MRDHTLCLVAKEKADAAKKAAGDTPQSKYRDRASERRVIYGQPDIPMPEQAVSQKKVAEGPPPPPTPPPPAVEPGKDESNVGHKLLKKMGWSRGSGLGADGEGRVDPMCVVMRTSLRLSNGI
jgi:RNA-binding protein 5/10